jgi:hypothetical protein
VQDCRLFMREGGGVCLAGDGDEHRPPARAERRVADQFR